MRARNCNFSSTVCVPQSTRRRSGLGLDRLPPPVPKPLDSLVAPVTHGQQSLITWVKLSTARHGGQVSAERRSTRASFQFAHNAKRMHSLVGPCEPSPPAVISSYRCRCPIVFSAAAIAHATAAVANQSAATGLSTRAGGVKGHGLILSLWQLGRRPPGLSFILPRGRKTSLLVALAKRCYASECSTWVCPPDCESAPTGGDPRWAPGLVSLRHRVVVRIAPGVPVPLRQRLDLTNRFRRDIPGPLGNRSHASTK